MEHCLGIYPTYIKEVLDRQFCVKFNSMKFYENSSSPSPVIA
jgi:hypothetical protein